MAKAIKMASVRGDLLEYGVKVPVGEGFYGDKFPLPYRWRGNNFQVKYKNVWEKAYSIDWDFV